MGLDERGSGWDGKDIRVRGESNWALGLYGLDCVEGP